MPTYRIAKPFDIRRQEGDTGEISITCPPILDLTQTPITRFWVVDTRNGKLVFKKEGNTTNINGQKILINLAVADTKGSAGTHDWELEISNTDKSIVHTIGRGKFIIEKELIP